MHDHQLPESSGDASQYCMGANYADGSYRGCAPAFVRVVWPSVDAFRVTLTNLGRDIATRTKPPVRLSFYRVRIDETRVFGTPSLDAYLLVRGRYDPDTAVEKQRSRLFRSDALDKVEGCFRGVASSPSAPTEVTVERFVDWFDDDCVRFPEDRPASSDWLGSVGEGSTNITLDLVLKLKEHVLKSLPPVAVVGLPFDARTFVTFATLLMSLIAVWVVGPLRTVWGCAGPMEDSSVVVTPTTGRWRWFEFVLIPVSVLWTLFPVGMASQITRLDVWWVGKVGAWLCGLAAMFVFGAVSIALWRLRTGRGKR